METLDQHYHYNEYIINEYLKKQNKFNLCQNIVNNKWISKKEIWKDVCDVNDKRIEFSTSDSTKKTNAFNQSYNLIIGTTDKRFIKGYKSLIWTLLDLLKTPEYKEYENEIREEIRLSFDYKYALEKQFWPKIIYKLDYLVSKHRPNFDNMLMTIEGIINLINKWKIIDLNTKIDENTEDVIKRFATERYNSYWELRH